MRALRALAASFSYFSILPVPSFDVPPGASVIAWLPLVGAFVGTIGGVCGAVAFRASGSVVWAVVAGFVAWIVLSGAIHVDGFLDGCDALLASVSPQRRLEILRDPRHGTYAVVGMVVLAVVWLGALASISPNTMPLALGIAAVVARASIVALPGQYPHARSGSRFDSCRVYGALWFVALLTLAAAFQAWKLLALVALAFALAQLIGRLMARRLGGGLTGDAYGAIAVIVEVLVLIALPPALSLVR